MRGPWAHRPRSSLPHWSGGEPSEALPHLSTQQAWWGAGWALRDGETLNAQGPEQAVPSIDFAHGVELLDFSLSPLGKQAHLKLCHIVTQQGQPCRARHEGRGQPSRPRGEQTWGRLAPVPSRLTSSELLGLHVDQVWVSIHSRDSPGKERLRLASGTEPPSPSHGVCVVPEPQAAMWPPGSGAQRTQSSPRAHLLLGGRWSPGLCLAGPRVCWAFFHLE